MKILSHCISLASLLAFCMLNISCKRDDEEPIRSRNSISRLYVSFSNYQQDSGAKPFENIRVIEPADQEQFDLGLQHVSEAKGGASIYFYPYSGLVFQSEEGFVPGQDTMIYVMSVGETGVLNNRGKIINNRLSGIKGLTYYKSNVTTGEESSVDNLYAASLFDSIIYAFHRPNTYSNKEVEPIQQIHLKDVAPWKILLNQKDLFVASTGPNGGVSVYNNFVDMRTEIIRDLEATISLRIKGVSNIRGMDYDPFTDILVLTDYSEDGGRLLFIENFSTLKTNQEVTPTRIVAGELTKLQRPMDVEFDRREGGKFLYVADQGSRSILRFEKGVNGNVVPDKAITTAPRIPVGLSLDARGPIDGNIVQGEGHDN